MLRIVVDTNILVSGICWPKSDPAKAYSKAVSVGELLISDAVREEQLEVFSRSKFAPYARLDLRLRFLQAHIDRCELILISEQVTECRDIGDNKILEVAVNGMADLILTGDLDLLALNPWRGIPVITPTQFLAFDIENDLP